jgi:hypothetical protein
MDVKKQGYKDVNGLNWLMTVANTAGYSKVLDYGSFFNEVSWPSGGTKWRLLMDFPVYVFSELIN